MKSNPQLPQIPKKPIDRLLERLRFNKAKTYIPKDTRLLDIGTGDGSFLRFLNGHILTGVGIDPLITTTIQTKSFTLLPGSFLKNYYTDERFDVITLLAGVEHIPENELHKVVDACWHLLTPDGRVIITVPHPCCQLSD